MSEATALPTAPLPLPKSLINVSWLQVVIDQGSDISVNPNGQTKTSEECNLTYARA